MNFTDRTPSLPRLATRTTALWMLSMAMLTGCAGAPEDGWGEEETVATAESALITSGWLGYVSEESWQNNRTCGNPEPGDTSGGNVITGARCEGSYCDNMFLYCARPKSLAKTDPGASWWTGYVSDEMSNSSAAFCTDPSGNIEGVVDGIRATGRYADNVSVRCSPFVTSPTHAYCEYTPWFSEEQPSMWFKFDYYAVGVQCRGSYCDQMRYYVCKFSNPVQ